MVRGISSAIQARAVTVPRMAQTPVEPNHSVSESKVDHRQPSGLQPTDPIGQKLAALFGSLSTVNLATASVHDQFDQAMTSARAASNIHNPSSAMQTSPQSEDIEVTSTLQSSILNSSNSLKDRAAIAADRLSIFSYLASALASSSSDANVPNSLAR